MQPNHLDRPAGKGRAAARRLALLLVLLSLAALTSACPSDGPSDNPTINTDPTPATGADDRPIIISGGSLGVYFNHLAYAETGGTGTQPQRYRLVGYKLANVRAYNDEGADNSAVICDTALGDNTTVTLAYSAGGPSASPSPGTSPSPGASPAGTPAAKQLTVTSGVGADGRSYVEVSIDTSTGSLPKRPAARDMHYNRSGRIESLSHGPTGGTATQCSPLPANRKVTVEINVAPVASSSATPKRS